MISYRSRIAVICLLLAAGCQSGADYPDPARFEGEIAAFEEQARTNPPPKGAIIAYGSSSIRMWHGTIREDLAPLEVIPRGFGGSTMHDASYFADRVIIPYGPTAILLYEGDNDIALGISPKKCLAAFKEFVAHIHAALPETRIYVLAIKPSIARWELWPEMALTNEMFREDCAKNELLTYVDIATPMLNENGTPREDIFIEDKLHMNAKGYEIWKEVVRGALIK